MSSISVLLIGASGALGGPLLKELRHQRSSFARMAVLTAPDRASKFDAVDVEVVAKSFYDPATYQGFTHVISAVGNQLMVLQPAMVDAAVAGGVKHFYASEWNSDISQKEIYDMRYFRDKQAVRSYLRQKAASTPGFQHTLMVTGIFTEWTVDAFYGFDHNTCAVELFGRPAQRIGVTSIKDIARYTIDSLHMDFTGPSRTIRVQGWTGKLEELIGALEEARGRKYTVTYEDVAVAKAKENEAREAGEDVQEMMFSIKPLLASGYGVADGTGKLDNDAFKFEPEHPVRTFRRLFQVDGGR